jgi:uncharacterized repeat protein (TIGR02543 family)
LGTYNVVYARWTANTPAPQPTPPPPPPQPNTKTLYFDSSGGSTPNPSSKVLTVNSTFGTLPTVSRSGYIFDGWYTEKGTKITHDTLYNGTYDRVYAHWTANTPTPQPTPPPQPNTKTLYFDSNGGNAPSFSSKVVTVNGTFGTLPTVSRSGYIFEGWYTKNENKITHDTLYMGTFDTVYAKWRK